jgi:DNA-binding GntR family transcriptional regulator
MTAVPLSRSRSTPVSTTVARSVAQELRRMIQAGELAAGERLRQTELAARFGVSTTPVREALTALEREGLIRYDAHRGAIVFPPTGDTIRENFEIRLALEPLATGLAAGRLTEEEFEALDDLAAALGTTVAQPAAGGLDRYEELDRAFHERIFVASGRPRLAEIIESLRDAFAAYAHLYAPGAEPDLLPTLQAQHTQLVTALRRGDAATASRIAVDHVLLTGSRHGFAADALSQG